MNSVEPPAFTYEQFCNEVRRFDQVHTLTGIARIAIALPDSAGDQRYQRTPPWTLAALVKASICNGNPYRSTPVRPNDIARLCWMYHNIKPEELNDPGLNPLFNMLVRGAYEQFPYQESVYEELARIQAFFDGYSGRKPLEVLDEAGVIELLSAPPRLAVGVAVMLHASAMINNGFFDPAWLAQDHFADVLGEVPREHIESVVGESFATDAAGFKRLAEGAPPLAHLERYMFNPLTARPFLRLADGRLIAPVPQLIPRRLSPIELYYQGIQRWGQPFTRDLGELFEDYIGRQLRTLPGATVHSEIKYGPKKVKGDSIDWIVVFPDLVVLVEAKAKRFVAAARAGAANAQPAIAEPLNDALTQIDRTYQAINDGASEFAHIPTDRPFLGLVATLDSAYMANSPVARDFLHQAQISTLVGSAREIETLVAIGQRRPAAEVLKQIADDPEMRTWMLGTALHRFQEPGDSNPILAAAYKRFPFSDPAKTGNTAA